jgi:hypothetical protein
VRRTHAQRHFLRLPSRAGQKKRCRMHGGFSTGPRTAAGQARSKLARWKHGRYSAEVRQEVAHFRELLRECKEVVFQFSEGMTLEKGSER